MDILDFGTPLGLAFASGLNAYLPLLAFSIAVRWLKLFTVNQHFSFVTQGWFIAVLVILTLLDFFADKIPIIDHAWNAAHTFVRPIAGAVVAVVASSHTLLPGIASVQVASEVTSVAFSLIPLGGIGLFVILIIIGAALALLSHTTKSTARLFSTVTTAGFFNAVLSLVEDALVLIITLLSLFASAVMLIVLVLLLFFLVPRFTRPRNSWIRRS